MKTVSNEDLDASLFEIISEDSDPSSSVWRKLTRNLAPFFAAGCDVIGNAYAAGAQAVLKKKEDIEDRRAGFKAANRQ